MLHIFPEGQPSDETDIKPNEKLEVQASNAATEQTGTCIYHFVGHS